MARRTARPSRTSRAGIGTEPVEGAYPVDTGTARLVRSGDDPDVWTLLLDGVPSSAVHLGHPERLEFEYLQLLAHALQLHPVPEPEPLDVVHLGGAACALPWAVETVRPGSSQVVAEHDGELARLVRTWFALPRSPRLRMQVGDARTVLAGRRDASADAVVRDVFAGDVTPAHLTTREFTADAARVLRPDGLYLANVADRPPLQLLKAEAATVATVFEHVGVVAETALLRGRRYANAVLVGSRRPYPWSDLQRAVGRTGLALRVLHGEPLARLVAGAQPLEDGSG